MAREEFARGSERGQDMKVNSTVSTSNISKLTQNWFVAAAHFAVRMREFLLKPKLHHGFFAIFMMG